jgi:hypothetical protein
MTLPTASFFGFFMAAILNLPDRPLSHKLLLLLIFLVIVAIEKLADLRKDDSHGIYPMLKGGICFFSFVALSVVYTADILDHPLKLFGVVVGGVLFGMAIYMPIRFQDAGAQTEPSDSLKRPLPKNPGD